MEKYDVWNTNLHFDEQTAEKYCDCLNSSCNETLLYLLLEPCNTCALSLFVFFFVVVLYPLSKLLNYLLIVSVWENLELNKCRSTILNSCAPI